MKSIFLAQSHKGTKKSFFTTKNKNDTKKDKFLHNPLLFSRFHFRSSLCLRARYLSVFQVI